MTDPQQSLKGQCHCGAVQFEVALSDGFKTLRRCTCSYCTMRGAAVVSAQLADIHFTQGEDKLTLYQFKTKTARHYFCSVCGIYTHHQRRSNPTQNGVNVACLEGISPFDFDIIPVFDGQNHPADSNNKTLGKVVGQLHFKREPQ